MDIKNAPKNTKISLKNYKKPQKIERMTEHFPPKKPKIPIKNSKIPLKHKFWF